MIGQEKDQPHTHCAEIYTNANTVNLPLVLPLTYGWLDSKKDYNTPLIL